MTGLATRTTLIAAVNEEEVRVPRNIRIRLSVLHQAKIAAVTAKKGLGHWLEEAIAEKIERDKG